MSAADVAVLLVGLNTYSALVMWAFCPWPLGGWTDDDAWSTERW